MAGRWKVICEYDGTDFCGWQTQPKGPSVQALIESRLSILFDKPICIHASGRTDAGVHARGQVFHFDADWQQTPERLLRAMRGTLPHSIVLRRIRPVTAGFHARFDATGKEYAYRYYLGRTPPHLARFHESLHPGITRKLDLDRMQDALHAFEGWHDFGAFAVNRGEAYDHTWRCISRAALRPSRGGQVLTLRFEGNGFLYKMVRSLTGAALGVATGQLTMDSLLTLLEGERRRHARITTAAAKGLSLERVFYRPRSYPPLPRHAPSNAHRLPTERNP